MPSLSDIPTIAGRHGLTEDAVRALADALERSRGGGAQWNHPDLGGMGQWLRGGMLQIGAMFDADLKRRVGAALEDLAARQAEPSTRDPASSTAAPRGREWWPEGLGTPSATGAQNAMRYACFPATRRLAVDQDGRMSVYDTGSYRLTGVSQSQSGAAQDLAFSGPDGEVRLGDLRKLA